ncbi:MAG: polyribonucleotide nucleotidyltransferase [Spirochaetia bacterium]|nr:polyribonucleotide nucleotidyltransferase [Spirochaetota bacterium]MCX8096201.1 polyribonucleotide nucleotidyltransferase [Spirochaetota bacterium]MDW8111713.1 polyribonucleotide nucleotidyltransferase [Spirochaetia bacterium]
MSGKKIFSKEIGGKKIIVETGELAKQSDASVLVRYGDVVVLSTVNYGAEVEGVDFVPLTVNFVEKFYASGKIPGGFVKRESKSSDKEILVSRLIDRPIRPLFPRGFKNEVQVITMVLSADQINPVDIVSVFASSVALMISSLPFRGPVGGVRVGYINGEYILNPTFSQLDESLLDIVVAGTERGITMIEGGTKGVNEEEMYGALEFANRYILELIEFQKEVANAAGKEKIQIQEKELPKEVFDIIWKYEKEMKTAMNVQDKKTREGNMDAIVESIKSEIVQTLGEEKSSEINWEDVNFYIEEMERDILRRQVLEEGIRIDGRKPKELRPIWCELGILPRTHGSAIFTRGQTQSLGITTLGSASDVQFIDDIEEEGFKRFMLHYNFPPFSTGEVKKLGPVSRREIGHGHLAERAIEAVLPSEEEFPYTIRVVSEILESNGSSSMATVCSSSLALVDAGVPIKELVAGIALGIVLDEKTGKYDLIVDIQGLEDKFGDMDFKVAGTRDKITAFQMDLKIEGLPLKILKEALYVAKESRNQILDIMEEKIRGKEFKLSEHAPRIKFIKTEPDKLADVIGPGGKVIKKIIQDTNVKIDISPEGKITISAKPGEGDIEKAYNTIMTIIEGVKVGDIITGQITRIEDYGVFVEVMPGKEGMIHISKLFRSRVKDIRDYLSVGDTITAKVISIDNLGRIALSRIDAERETISRNS